MNNDELNNHFFNLLFKEQVISGDFIFTGDKKYNWSDIVIEKAKLQNVCFENISFMDGGFNESKLDNIIFRNCELDILSFVEVELRNVKFEECLFETGMNNCLFDSVRISRPVLMEGAFLERAYKNLEGIDIVESDKVLGNLRFEGIRIRNRKFQNCRFINVKFANCKLDEVTFQDCFFDQCHVDNCELEVEFLNCQAKDISIYSYDDRKTGNIIKLD